MCVSALFVETTLGYLSMKNSVSMFRAPDASECTMGTAYCKRFENTSST
jgi:hypothetical protein